MFHLLLSMLDTAFRQSTRGAVLVLATIVFSVCAQPAADNGRALFLDPRKGNCAACHALPGTADLPVGSRVGPDLIGIGQRYPDREKLRAEIGDMSAKLPNTIMPPFGRHRILTQTEIDAIIRFLEKP